MEQQKILSLILSKLDNIEKEQQEMKKEQQEMKKELQGMKKDQHGIRKELQGMKKDQLAMKARQDEMYIMQGEIEENIKITRAEQENMKYILADIQGKVTTLANEGKDHDAVINQIRAIK